MPSLRRTRGHRVSRNNVSSEAGSESFFVPSIPYQEFFAYDDEIARVKFSLARPTRDFVLSRGPFAFYDRSYSCLNAPFAAPLSAEPSKSPAKPTGNLSTKFRSTHRTRRNRKLRRRCRGPSGRRHPRTRCPLPSTLRHLSRSPRRQSRQRPVQPRRGHSGRPLHLLPKSHDPRPRPPQRHVQTPHLRRPRWLRSVKTIFRRRTPAHHRHRSHPC